MGWGSSPWPAHCGRPAAAAISWPGPMEGEELRAILPEATIYVLDGLFPGQAEFYAKLDLCPALISTGEAKEWAAFGRVYGRKLPCAIHVDTGINRLGFSIAEFNALLDDRFTMEGLNVTLLMSHLACADDPSHPLNAKQREAFAAVRARLPGVPASLANSAASSWATASPMIWSAPASRSMAEARCAGKSDAARRLSRRHGHAGAQSFSRARRWAMAPPGRRSGRAASPYWAPATRTACPAPCRPKAGDGPAQVFIDGRRCPIIGRVSMDMMAIDITGLSRARHAGHAGRDPGRQHSHRRGRGLGGHHILRVADPAGQPLCKALHRPRIGRITLEHPCPHRPCRRSPCCRRWAASRCSSRTGCSRA